MATSSGPIGININGIGKIKRAIEIYKSAVKKKADIGAKRSVIEKAIKGSRSEAALQSMCTRIDTQINNMLKELDKYSSYLDTLATTYKKSDEQNTSFSTVAETVLVGGTIQPIQSKYGVPDYGGQPIQSKYGVPDYGGQPIQSKYGVPDYGGQPIQSKYGVPDYGGQPIQSKYGVPDYK